MADRSYLTLVLAELLIWIPSSGLDRTSARPPQRTSCPGWPRRAGWMRCWCGRGWGGPALPNPSRTWSALLRDRHRSGHVPAQPRVLPVESDRDHVGDVALFALAQRADVA